MEESAHLAFRIMLPLAMRDDGSGYGGEGGDGTQVVDIDNCIKQHIWTQETRFQPVLEEIWYEIAVFQLSSCF